MSHSRRIFNFRDKMPEGVPVSIEGVSMPNAEDLKPTYYKSEAEALKALELKAAKADTNFITDFTGLDIDAIGQTNCK